MQTHSDKLSKDLKLNDQQRIKLQEHNTKHCRNQQHMHGDNATGSNQSDAQRNKSNEDYDSELKNIPDDDQYKRYSDNRDKYQFQSSGQ